MKKNNQTTATTTADDLKTLISSHVKFFDELVESIPARFYLPSNDDKPWFQGLSKARKASAKRQTIENLRKAKQSRFDPEKSSKTTLDFLKDSLKSEKKPEGKNKLSFDSEGEGDDGEDGNGEMQVTYEELQVKMKRKMEELRGGRSRGEGYERRKEKREAWKRKQGEFEGAKGNVKRKAKEVEDERVEVEKEVNEAAKEIEFGKVKLSASIDDGETAFALV